jgi:hypothetical protein
VPGDIEWPMTPNYGREGGYLSGPASSRTGLNERQQGAVELGLCIDCERRGPADESLLCLQCLNHLNINNFFGYKSS